MEETEPSVEARSLYRLSRKPLGAGSYAKVFHATHRESGAEVALKRAHLGSEARHRIRREIRAQKQLAHPNIMPIWDHDPGLCWYTMPLAHGTLEDLRSDLDEEQLESILFNLADALEVAHRDNLVHRDISPCNILALPGSSSGRFRWVVADWGLVRRPSGGSSPALTRTGQGMGTPGFDAPEIIEDPRTALAAADVYSLGRVAAWFLTNKRPISGIVLLPEGEMLHWRAFVKTCTESVVEHRVGSMAGLRAVLRDVFTYRDQPASQRAHDLIESLLLRTTRGKWRP